jgi:putative modified peptide
MSKHSFDQLSTMLDKLATDDGFRDRMLGDPVRALGGLGIAIDPASVPAERSLPSRESVAAEHAALESTHAGHAGMVLFLLSGVTVDSLAA